VLSSIAAASCKSDRGGFLWRPGSTIPALWLAEGDYRLAMVAVSSE
jgi:hypothetical protein